MDRTEDRRGRRLAVAGCVVAAVFATGVLVSALGRPDRAPEESTEAGGRSRPPSIEPGETTVVAGMPAGFERDEDGAVEAAVAFATASQRWLYFTDAEVSHAVAQIATPGAADRIEAEVLADVAEARARLGESPGRVWWLVRPLAWNVESHTGGVARVTVWVVTVLSAAQVASPQSEWMTVTLDMEWVGGDWRVDEVRNDPGPTPMVGPGDRPWDAVPFDEALDGFTRIDGEPVR